MNNFYEEDKRMALEWMSVFCSGFRQARTRKEILPCMNFKRIFDNPESKDRYFRKIVSSLIHEGHLCSHNSRGYWFKPLYTNDPEEIEAIKQSIMERKSRALSSIEGCDRQLREVEGIRQGQQVMLAG